MLALTIFSVALGLCLARFNVLAVLTVVAVLVVGLFIYDMVCAASLAHSCLASAIVAFFLPASYLLVQLLSPPQP